MTFNSGDVVQPVKGGPVLRVVKVEDGRVFCEPKNAPAAQPLTFSPQELSLYKEEGDFGVC